MTFCYLTKKKEEKKFLLKLKAFRKYFYFTGQFEYICNKTVKGPEDDMTLQQFPSKDCGYAYANNKFDCLAIYHLFDGAKNVQSLVSSIIEL